MAEPVDNLRRTTGPRGVPGGHSPGNEPGQRSSAVFGGGRDPVRSGDMSEKQGPGSDKPSAGSPQDVELNAFLNRDAQAPTADDRTVLAGVEDRPATEDELPGIGRAAQGRLGRRAE